jgi:hypothetical protein
MYNRLKAMTVSPCAGGGFVLCWSRCCPEAAAERLLFRVARDVHCLARSVTPAGHPAVDLPEL